MAETNKQSQKMRFSDLELSLIKNSFLNADEFIRAIRKVFLQMPLDEGDRAYIDGLRGKPELLAVIRKAYLPTLDPLSPIHQLVDLWLTVEVKDKSPEQAMPHLEARATLVAYLDQQLNYLEGNIPSDKSGYIELEDLKNIAGKTPEKAYADLVARNTLIGHNEMQLNQFLILANLESESVDDTKKRLAKDSSQ